MGEAGDPVNVKRGTATTPSTGRREERTLATGREVEANATGSGGAESVDRGGHERRTDVAPGAPVDPMVGDAGLVADGGAEGPTMTMQASGQSAGDLASTTSAPDVDGKMDTTGKAKEEDGVDAARGGRS